MDLTVKFKQICRIVEDEFHISHKAYSPNAIIRHEEIEFNTNFIKDSQDLNKLIVEFAHEITDLRGRYLLIDQGDEEEKDYIDDQSLIYMNNLNKMFKRLEKLHQVKSDLDEQKLNKKFRIPNVDAKAYLSTMMEVRAHIVKYLLEKLKRTTDELTEMKQIRLNKRKQLSSLSNYTNTTSIQIIEEEEEGQQKSKFTNAQLQELSMENNNLLIANKEDELVQITKLENSVMEMLNLQNQLVHHLNEQDSKIDQITENNEFIMTDLKNSNKQLRKAQASFNDRGNYLMYILIFSGVLVLLIDYIKP